MLSRAGDTNQAALEFRELTLARGAAVICGFTARRGEFYLEGVETGSYELRLDGEPACHAMVTVQEIAAAMTDLGRVDCAGAPR